MLEKQKQGTEKHAHQQVGQASIKQRNHTATQHSPKPQAKQDRQ